jgi:hypothetical protein
MKVLRVGLSVAAAAALLWGVCSAQSSAARSSAGQSSTVRSPGIQSAGVGAYGAVDEARLRQSDPSEWLAEPRRAGLLIEVDTLSWRP